MHKDESNSTRQHGGALGGILFVLVVGAFIYMLLSPKANKDGTTAVTDPIVEISAAQPSLLRPDGELAEIFALGTNSTELQREDKLTQIRGQVVQWTLPVYEVSRAGDRYKIQTQGNSLAFMGRRDLLLGTFIYLSSRNEQDSQVIAALKTGDLISVKGRIVDSTLRHLVLDPAVLAYQRVAPDAAEAESTKLTIPPDKVTGRENKKTSVNMLETRYGSFKIVGKKEDSEDYQQLLFRGKEVEGGKAENLWVIGNYTFNQQDAILLGTSFSNPRSGTEFTHYLLVTIGPSGDAKFVSVGGDGGQLSVEDGSEFTPKVVDGDLVMNLGFAKGLLRKAVFDGRTLSLTSKKPSLDEVFPIAPNHCSDILYVVQNYCTQLESCIVPKEGIQLLRMDYHKEHHPALTTAKFSNLCRTVCQGKNSLSESNFNLEFCGIK